MIKSQDELNTCNDGKRKSDVRFKPNGNLTGKRFGRLTVICLDHKKPRKNGGNILFWKCKCDCGNEKVIRGDNLRSNTTTSCGCFARENTSKIKKIHGQRNSRLYNIWNGVKDRIFNKNNQAFSNYGGRGLGMFDEWVSDFTSFYNWSIQNGYDESLSIDRIDNNKGYTPDNCRWVNSHLQASNRRIQKNNKTGYAGIYFCNTEKLYKSQITINKKSHTIGRFKTIKEALDARNNYIKQYNLFEYKIQ